VLVDKSRNTRDVPHDYVEFIMPVGLRHLRIENVHMPTGRFALAGLRVFGKGSAEIPPAVEGLSVLRHANDRRNATIVWPKIKGAYAYNILFGMDMDRLYNSMLVYNAERYDFRGMDTDTKYFFAIEAVSEGGISTRSAVVEVP
jgi:hypothetical protein